MSGAQQDARGFDALAALDAVDRRLVELLAANARTPNAQLAAAVGIAQSTCIARVRSLVERGVIQRFTVELGLPALGLGLQALISVSIRSGRRQELARFAEHMRGLSEVTQVFFLGGSEDFIVHVAVRDAADVREFVVAHLSAHPAVASTRTSLVFDHHRSR